MRHRATRLIAIACIGLFLAGCFGPKERNPPLDQRPDAGWWIEGGTEHRRYQRGHDFAFETFTLEWNRSFGDVKIVGLAWADEKLVAATLDGPILIVDSQSGQLERILGGLDQAVDAPLIVGDALVVFGVSNTTQRGSFRILSWANGSRLADVSSPVALRDLGAKAAVVDEALIFEDSGGFVRSIQIRDQRVNWEFEVDNPENWTLSTSGLLVSNGVVYAGMQDAVLYALEQNTGQLLWTYNHPGGDVVYGPASDGERIYFVTNSEPREIVALSAGDGAFAWSYFTGSTIPHPPLVANGKVFAYSWDGRVYAINSSDGSIAWTFRIDDSSCVALRFCGKDTVGIAYSSGILVVQGRDGTLRAFDAETGSLRSSYAVVRATPDLDAVTPIIVDDVVYLGVGNRILSFSMTR